MAQNYCSCGVSYDNNCAHRASVTLGVSLSHGPQDANNYCTSTDGSGFITCPAGRIVRADELYKQQGSVDNWNGPGKYFVYISGVGRSHCFVANYSNEDTISSYCDPCVSGDHDGKQIGRIRHFKKV
jgi:hypothetical protein